MKINRLNIDSFSKFHQKTFEFTDGINLIYGENEAGKSTIHIFIKSILFGIEQSKFKDDKNYATLKPWDNGAEFSGSMDITFNDKEYRIKRTFLDADNKLEVIELATGMKVDMPEEFIKELLLGLNIITFKNTISVSQLHSVTENTVAHELKNFIATMDPSEDPSLDATGAIEMLKDQKAELESKISADATQARLLTLAEISKKEQIIVDDKYKVDVASLQDRQDVIDNKVIEINTAIDDTQRSIAWHKKMLTDRNIKKKQDLEKILAKTDVAYAKFTQSNDSLKKSLSLNSKIIIVTLAILLLLISGLTFLAFFSNSQLSLFVRGLFPDLVSFITSIPLSDSLIVGSTFATGSILIVLSIIFISGDMNITRTKTSNEKILKKFFREYINAVDVNKKTYKMFNEEINKYIGYIDKILDSNNKLEDLRDEKADLQEESTLLKNKIASAKIVLDELEQNVNEINSLKEKSQSLKNAIKANEDATREIEAINLAIEALKDVSTQIKVSLARYLNEDVSEFVKKITNGAYDSISVDDRLNIYLNTPDRLVPISSVSRGTMDQIYLALRLGAAKLIMDRSGSTLPLLFDETFTLYDDSRLLKTLEFLSSRYEGQIILFTCQSREKQTLEELNIPFTYIEV